MKFIFLVLSFVFAFHLVNLSANDPVTLSTSTPSPTEYVTDYTGILDDTIKASLDSQLKDYEAKTSNQVIVVVAENAGNGELDSTCNAVFHKWGIGQKGKNNGVVLFWFPEIRKLRIAVGEGLEGALPEIIAKRIIDDEITPCFKKQQWGHGLQQGVDGIIKATKGEYKNAAKGSGEGVMFFAAELVFSICESLFSVE